jgi:hypothetical protein
LILFFSLFDRLLSPYQFVFYIADLESDEVLDSVGSLELEDYFAIAA